MTTKDVTDHDVIEMMTCYGGSFVQALAHAARRADADSLARIKATWPEYWAQYAEMAVLRERARERAE